MKRVVSAMFVCLSLLMCVLASCITREAAQRHQDVLEGGEKEKVFYTVTFCHGDTVLSQQAVAEGEHIYSAPEAPSWTDESGAVVDIAKVTVDADMTFYYRNRAAVRAGHVRYMNIEDDQFHPEGTVTRGQMAQLVSALLDADPEEYTWVTNPYSDVSEGSPYYASALMLQEMDIMRGFGDGTFRPDEPVTRAEMVTILCRMTDTAEVPARSFDDVPTEHWALGEIAAAMTKGWLSGYDDGQFYPDSPVTRAETVVLFNRVRGRNPNRLAVDTVCAESPYTDVDRRYWAYYDIVDVSYSNELLAYILGDVEGVEPGFILLGEEMCHVDPETLCLNYYEKGFHTVADGLESDGLYYVPEDGYFFRRNPEGLQEFDGSMFYVEKEDGPFQADFKLGYLKFGEDGRYTSGDKELDGYVDAIMAGIIQGKTSNLLNENKLREAYDYLQYGGYGYMSRPIAWKWGSTSWAKNCAKTMFRTKRGACFYWAGAFLYLARRLGYQAYPISGGVWGVGAPHAWVMIDEGGVPYIYDVELEWGLRTGGGGRYEINYAYGSLFKQSKYHAKLIYWFPGEKPVGGYGIPADVNLEDLLQDTPAIIMPSQGDAVGTQAYVEEDGEIVYLATNWTPNYEDGVLVSYTVTAEYKGSTYSVTILAEGGGEPGPGGEEPGPEPTPGGEEPGPEPTPGGQTGEPTPTPGSQTGEPTPTPGNEPSAPTPTAAPTKEPAAEPTKEPAAEPTPAPTAEPTKEPAPEPTTAPETDPSGSEIEQNGD